MMAMRRITTIPTTIDPRSAFSLAGTAITAIIAITTTIAGIGRARLRRLA
jgi:hypothetical protein